MGQLKKKENNITNKNDDHLLKTHGCFHWVFRIWKNIQEQNNATITQNTLPEQAAVSEVNPEAFPYLPAAQSVQRVTPVELLHPPAAHTANITTQQTTFTTATKYFRTLSNKTHTNSNTL